MSVLGGMELPRWFGPDWRVRSVNAQEVKECHGTRVPLQGA